MEKKGKTASSLPEGWSQDIQGAPCTPVPAGSQQTCPGFLPLLLSEVGGSPSDDAAELILLCQELLHIPLKSHRPTS